MVLALRQTAASIELDAGNYREAVAKLEEIRRSMTGTAGLTTADNRITACVNLAVAYAKAGQRRESLAEAEMCRTELRALADSGHRGAAFRYLGDVFRLAGRRTDARECYDAAIERLDRIGTFGVESVEAHLGLAELRIDEGDLTAAGRELDLATRGLERATPKLRQRVADARARHAAASRDG
jgi:tetratricopeptide (TPR) repeat protein